MRRGIGFLFIALALSLGLVLTMVWLVGSSPRMAWAQPGIIRVATSGSDAPGCGDESTPCRTVQYAVGQAGTGSEIRVAAGVYTGVNSYGGLSQVVYLTKTLAVRGGYTTTNWTDPDPVANPTTLDAEGQGRVLVITGTITPTIEGLRLTGGDASGLGGHPSGFDAGGGVYLLEAAATFTNCAISGNTASTADIGAGGGLYLEGGHSTLSGNTVISNTANIAGDGVGGGLYLLNDSSLLEGNTIRDNAGTIYTLGTGMGGGLCLEESNATLRNNMVSDNAASLHGMGAGGGLAVNYSDGASLSGNSIQGNVASVWSGIGGGLYVCGSNATLDGNTIASNTAGTYNESSGGGLLLLYSDATLIDNTVEDNTACTADVGSGGGMYIVDSNALLSGNLVRGNLASTGGEGSGGGLYLADNYATLTGNVIVSNTASTVAQGFGGGLYLDWDMSTLDNNTVQGHVAGTADAGYGGGLWVINSSAMLSANTVVSNAATLSPTADGWGGGIRVEGGTDITLINNVVADNRANTAGDGLSLDAGWGFPVTGQLLHTTIADNGSAVSGQGVHVGTLTTLAFTNTIVAGHGDTGVYVDLDSSVTLEATLWHGNGADSGGAGTIVSTTNLYGDPAFVNPVTWDYHLTTGSAAIDVGVDAGVTSDIDGHPRPIHDGYDPGADEYPVGVDFDPDHSGRGDPGTVVAYTHMLTNTGAYPDVFDLIHTSSQGWPVSYNTPIGLDAGQMVTLTVSIAVPADTPSGTLDITVLTATSQTDPDILASATDTTAVNHVPGVALDPSHTRIADPGTIVTYTHTLSNAGNGADVFAITHASSRDWTVTYDTPIALGARQTITLVISITVPVDVLSGIMDRTMITAASQTDPNTFDTVVDTTMVAGGPWKLYLPIVSRNHD